MKYAFESVQFILPDESIKNATAHIYETKQKQLSSDGFFEKSIVKVRVPKGENFSPFLGQVAKLNGADYVVTLIRKNFKGINPHYYIELRG